MRKLARSVAKYNMQKQGYTQILKKHKDGSQFAKVWRQFVGMIPIAKPKPKTKKKKIMDRLTKKFA